MGAHVTAVCGTGGVETVGSLGAERVIDYTREDFTAIAETFDVVFDAVGKPRSGAVADWLGAVGRSWRPTLASCGRTRS